MKIVVPIAGIGSRLKPHTHTVPKPLMDVAGKPILEHVIRDCEKLKPTEVIFVVGYKKKSIKDYINKYHPKLNCSFVEQKTRDGPGSAVRIALENIKEDEELFIIFGGDTLVDFNIASYIKKNKDPDALIFTKKVDKPSNYGIVNVYDNNEIYGVEEKPEKPKSDQAIIGAYYFRSLLLVKKNLNYLYNNHVTTKGEYGITELLDSYIKMKDKSIKSVPVDAWFDCGRPEVLLEANTYFLNKNSSNKKIMRGNSIIIPPSYVAKDAKLDCCVIGPNVSIGSEVEVKNSVIKNSVISYQSSINNIVLKDSIIGKQVTVDGKKSKLNIGEKSHIVIN